jgi:two-component system KDP operon response regulator KdpE
VLSKKILIIDDDPHNAQLLKSALSQAGASVILAADGQAGLNQFTHQQPDLVILDIILPVIDGWEVCRRLRQVSDTPIIIVSILDDDNSVIRGLYCGANSYIHKPFSVPYLLALVKSNLRQTEKPEKQPLTPGSYKDSYLDIDLTSFSVSVAGKQVALTKKELDILGLLLRNRDQVVTHEQILAHAWGRSATDQIQYVHIYIYHLRKKLEKNPKKPDYFQRVHGLGYCFTTRQENA